MATSICKVGTEQQRKARAIAHHNGEHDCNNRQWAKSCPDCYFELLAKGHFQ